jgi:hypothetical protein
VKVWPDTALTACQDFLLRTQPGQLCCQFFPKKELVFTKTLECDTRNIVNKCFLFNVLSHIYTLTAICYSVRPRAP